jgi:hypothetical protein
MNSADNKPHRISVSLRSDAGKNFGGAYFITEVAARTDWSRPTFRPFVQIGGKLEDRYDESSQMKSFSIIVAPEVLIYCLNAFQFSIAEKIEVFEKRITVSMAKQMISGMALIASRLSLLIEGDPRWREIVELISKDEDIAVGSASDLADIARAAFDDAIRQIEDIEFNVDDELLYKGMSDLECLDKIMISVEMAMNARHARSLIADLEDFFLAFDISLPV